MGQRKILGYKKNFGSGRMRKNFVSGKSFGSGQKLLFRGKILGEGKILGDKKLWVRKFFWLGRIFRIVKEILGWGKHSVREAK